MRSVNKGRKTTVQISNNYDVFEQAGLFVPGTTTCKMGMLSMSEDTARFMKIYIKCIESHETKVFK